MFVYNKKLQFPVKIAKTDPKLASIIISQYGGPDGELGASLRYLSQRFTMPYDVAKGALTDIGIEDFFWLSYIYFTIQDKTVQDNTSQVSIKQDSPNQLNTSQDNKNTIQGRLRSQATAYKGAVAISPTKKNRSIPKRY